ncbi:hypothetical protein HMPREF1552_00697 [Leptotrichia sp. oral taxon 879 str. F0557]|nr:hypothetical protein HMPREF1552_00697 [Leptotrichia sp. oral taxon 879 str. F0557]
MLNKQGFDVISSFNNSNRLFLFSTFITGRVSRDVFRSWKNLISEMIEMVLSGFLKPGTVRI